MAIIRQMPGIYLRGSLANVTMKELTQDQIDFCNRVTKQIASSPGMAKHRFKMTQVLGETIGADYKIRTDAEQEYYIAIWRGVVNLFFHRYYTFKCEACNGTHRIAKTTGLPVAINQIKTPCPACNQCKVTDPGDTDFEEEQFVDYEEFQNSYKDFTTGIPECGSTIKAIKGEKRYKNPQEILDDSEQMTKFFGEFVWGYFKQQLRENHRTEHNKKPVLISGRADQIITEMILSACKKLKINTIFCKELQPENEWWTIGLYGVHTPPEFTGELIPILDKSKELGVKIVIKQTCIQIQEVKSADIIEAFVIKPEHVSVLENNTSISDKDEGFTIDQMSFKTVKGEKMDLEDHVRTIELRDTMEEVFDSLPDGNCRLIFQLYTQNGEIYDRFHQEYKSPGEPKQGHMAKFLGITPRVVKGHIAHIKHTCLANGLTPN